MLIGVPNLSDYLLGLLSSKTVSCLLDRRRFSVLFIYMTFFQKW